MVLTSQSHFLKDLEVQMRDEVARNWQHLNDIWALPLRERVQKGHSLGPLKLISLSDQGVAIFAHQSDHSREAFCSLREGDLVRVTRDDPVGNGPNASFLHDDGDQIALSFASVPRDFHHQSEGYTIDPDFFDPTERFLAALNRLATTAHGQEKVLPILMGTDGGRIATDEQFEITLALENDESSPLHHSQVEAIANCVSAQNFHLVQGPPGTGKTHVLAQTASRLIAKDQRLLITGPTHRAIQNALSAIRSSLPPSVPVVKIGDHPFIRDPAVPQFKTFSQAKLPEDSPYVLGATPYALWSHTNGLLEREFDTVLCDESSQITILLAALAMLRAHRFLFFGDHRQLPPVRLGPAPKDETEQSVFSHLAKWGNNTPLTESWRLNEELSAWPSATFYNHELTSRHNHQLVLTPASNHPALQATSALVAISHSGDSHSTFHPDEAETVVELLLALLRGGIRPSEVAVITPFRAQAARIRGMLLRRQEFEVWSVGEIACDTIERLQGQEREVILFSLASSQPSFIEGLRDFLFQPQRLNVAVTRARCKTIILHSESLFKIADTLSANHRGAMVFCSLIETATQLTDSHGHPHS